MPATALRTVWVAVGSTPDRSMMPVSTWRVEPATSGGQRLLDQRGRERGLPAGLAGGGDDPFLRIQQRHGGVAGRRVLDEHRLPRASAQLDRLGHG